MDELVTEAGEPRPVAAALMQLIDSIGVTELSERQRVAELDIRTMGITFTVYSEGQNIDRAWPFDIIPRVIPGAEWDLVTAGLGQRLRALNLFIDDLYNDQRVVADGVFPADLLEESVNFRPQCRGIRPPHGVWAHISGTDLVRDDDGQMYVLEDNLRVPSGVSYVIENRGVAKRAFAELFERQRIRPVDSYTDELNRLLTSLAPAGVAELHSGSSPNGWGPSWSRAPTSSSATTTACTPGRSGGSSVSTSSTAASMTCSSTPRSSSRTRCSVCPV
jgi:uncharacterized circularly permuted ATP-grasp superfamily protein